MSPHRNRLVGNVVENNGQQPDTPGIRIRGAVEGLIFQRNTIRDTREDQSRRQTVGILMEESVGEVVLDGNEIEAPQPIIDRRRDGND